MRFLSKIRERQFAKKWGRTYNLSRAVLAGVLAAGCLMPGFAEAASLVTDINTNLIERSGNTATIIGSISGGGLTGISWGPGAESNVSGCFINVDPITIEPEIYIYAGNQVGNHIDVNNNAVNINGTTFQNKAHIYGGRTASFGTVTGNKVTIKDTTFTSTSWIYGGLSNGTATNNKVIISGGTFNANVYGGYSDYGEANYNQVSISGDGTFNGYHVCGGYTDKGAADYNQVSIDGGTFYGYVVGGWADSDGTANNNLVSINGGTFNDDISGGYTDKGAADYNKVSINGGTFNGDFDGGIYVYGGESYSETPNKTANNNQVIISGGNFNGDIDVYGGYSDSVTANLNSVIISGGEFNGNLDVYGGQSDYGTANENSVSISGGTFNDYVYVYGGYSGPDEVATYSGNTSSNGDVTGNKVEISGNTKFEGGSSISGGYSDYGEANLNSVSINGGTFDGDIDGDIYVFGGESYSVTPNKTANLNSVIISGGTFNGYVHVFGGYSDSDTAQYNQVIISGGEFNDNIDVYGGYSYSSTAQYNQVIISGGKFNDNIDVYGGYSDSGEANDNKVILIGNNANYKFTDTQGTKHTLTGGNINITGIVYGGRVYNDGLLVDTTSGNEIHVYGSNINVGNIKNFEKLRFFIDDTLTFGETMLTINGIPSTEGIIFPNVIIPNNKLAVTVTGKPQASGDKNTITLVHTSNGEISHFKNDGTPVPVEIGATLSGDGSVALSGNQKDLVLTLNVEKTTVNENGKSLVETRAAAAFVVNNMSDFMLGTGMEQAKAAAGGVTPIDEGTMAPFAAVGGSNMRYTTGSYVDVNGWNGAVGFAKQADKLLFGVAVEHGRGNYDSYLDNGVHASGDIKSTGGVIFGEYKLDNGVHYDAALRAGRVKSDYNSTATSYDESSAYYGFSLGGGKELTVSDKATVDVYGRYYFSHTNGSDVSIATGEEIDFDAVNSHRLRIGGRYTTTLTEKSKAYAGLAWQYEFGGDAKAAINGYSAPTPSLQGHSAIVEAGYKLNAGKNLTLDFNLNGAMGKQRGIGGGIGAQWLF
ncbi:MAG: autotransporter outer membrane beta-barrel domain-containing protein [Phascolarctobacterium sp.]|nr:autotransporter outer membrane beta-barrel domain-containing protein [Phascolarctobacterium sp.]